MAIEVTAHDGPGALPQADREALGAARQPSPFARLEWFARVAAHCPPPGRALVLRAGDGARTAWLFLMVERGHARALACWYSLDFAVAGDPPQAASDAALLAVLAQALRRHRIARLSLSPMRDPAPLAAALRAAGWLVRRPQVSCRRYEAVADHDGWWRQRPARLRNTVRRAAPKLEIELHRDYSDLARITYEAVYAASWKPDEGAPGFLRDLARHEGAAGRLRLGIARHRGRAVAAQLWLVEGGTATIHKLAHREDARALSPGSVLTAAMARDAIERDHVCMLDFGLGDDAYKGDWMAGREPVHALTAIDLRSPAGLLAGARLLAARLVRRRGAG